MAKQKAPERLSEGALTQEGAERIVLLLKRQRLSQRQIEREAGLSEGQLSRMLKRTRPMSLSQLQAVASALGVSASDLLSPAADAAAAADVPQSLDNEKTGISSSTGPALEALVSTGDTGRGARASSPMGALRPRWLRVYRWGSMADPRRPGDGVGSGAYEVRLVAEGYESDTVGPDGFGVAVDNESISNWEGVPGHAIHGGAIAWCNPTKRADVQDGDLVVAYDPLKGLLAGVYRDTEAGLFLETDDPTLAVQERRRCQPAWVLGPVVLASASSGVRRRPRGRPGEHNESVGPAFVRRAASGSGVG